MARKGDEATGANAATGALALEEADSPAAPAMEIPAAPEENSAASAAAEDDGEADRDAVGEDEREAAGSARPTLPIFLRYDPVYREGSDLVLWYRIDPEAAASSGLPGLSLFARWHGDDGRVLVWEGETRILNFDDPGHWQPLRL